MRPEDRQRPDHQHDAQQHERGDRDLGERLVRAVKVFEYEPQMQPDIGEYQRLQHYVDRVPHIAFMQPGLIGGAQRSIADDETRDDDGQHT
jgi:hypothetical protein